VRSGGLPLGESAEILRPRRFFVTSYSETCEYSSAQTNVLSLFTGLVLQVCWRLRVS
jgi:hypothetical protein